MFSRSPATTNPNVPARKMEAETPLDELITVLERIEALVEKARNDWEEKNKQPPPKQERKPRSGGLWRRGTSDKSLEPEEEAKTRTFRKRERSAKFLPLPKADVTELVELLRRTAELVVTGEKGAAAALSNHDKRIKRRMENPDDEELSDEEDGDKESAETYIALFEQFFERNALSLIVNMVTGAAFAPSSLPSTGSFSNLSSSSLDLTEDSQDDSCTMLPPLPVATQAVQSVSILVQNVSRATSLYFLLSNNHINELINLPLELYTIAEQQNLGDNSKTMPRRKYSSPELAELNTHFVSLLKSLALRMNKETLQFFLTYPTERYDFNSSTASSAYFSLDDTLDVKKPRRKRTSAPREDRPLDEIETNRSAPDTSNNFAQPVAVPEVKVEFPLYARALDFCSANQDSFVRVTAMNICLNTLRLATVSDADDDGIDNPGVASSPSKSSPDAVLHNAEPLPIRERLAIAQHVCAPSRVEGLVSPIFTKLAQLWGVLEELIREVDAPVKSKSGSYSAPSSGNIGGIGDNSSHRRPKTKADKAKEDARRSRLSDSVKDTLADIQDEYLLLEDVFKVGLTSLNEQVVEMMFATFVYPLLLQPLLLYTQRFPSEQSSSTTVNPFSTESLSNSLRQSGMLGNLSSGILSGEHEFESRQTLQDTAPAKTACFALAGVFHFVTNRPLLRLLLTALFHPLAPEASGDSMIRAQPDVACARADGGVYLRLDEPCILEDSELIPNDRSTYLFGKLTGRRYSGNVPYRTSGQQDNGTSQEASCVFVLAPALAAVLESTGSQLSLISRTRPNPYRRAMLSCVSGNGAFSALRSLSTMAIDAAFSKFEGGFISDVLFGAGMMTFANDIPMDERRTDTRIVRDMHDRDIGGAGVLNSRRSLSSGNSQFGRAGGGSNYNVEVVSSLCMSVVSASSTEGSWSLKFDRIAVHALLCAIRENPRAMQTTAKMIERRRYHVASFLSQLPSHIDEACLRGEFQSGEGDQYSSDDEEQHLGTIMNRIFYGPVVSNKNVVERLFRFKGTEDDGYSVSIALESSFSNLSDGLCKLDDQTSWSESDTSPLFEMAARCAHTYCRLDALSTLMQDLAATSATTLQNRKLAGFAVSRNGSTVSTDEAYENDVRCSVFGTISHSLGTTLIEEREADVPSHRDRDQPKPGSVVGLVGRTAFPCVAEVAPATSSFFAEETSVVSEGVKWQSLYLVFLGNYMVLAEPERGGSGGNGRIITSCSLSRLKVDRDAAMPAHTGSTARRLLLSYDSFDLEPPGLFLFEEKPSEKLVGPFVQVQNLRSCVDLWFEDETSVERAEKVLEIKISKAKSRRGNRLIEKLGSGR